MEVGPGGFVVTDESCRTTLDGVFAAGDVAGPPLLAHWAYHQGTIAAENAVTGASLALRPQLVPNCVFSSPEVASCGLTEDRARPEGVEHEVAHVRFNGNSKAVVRGRRRGLRAHRLRARRRARARRQPRRTARHRARARARPGGPRGLTLADIAGTIHAHPTLSEAVGEAALGGVGRGVHSL